jgi:predicted O-methyltransferase YrrM
MESLWNNVDDYFVQQLSPSDDALDHALEASVAAGLPAIAVAPNQGKLLHLLVRIRNARRVLEIGTLGGYSTIWMARALPSDGQVITLELEPAHAEVARKNVDRAGVGDRVHILVGPASESLAKLAAAHTEPFDFVFIDADKASTERYFRAALGMSRVGTVIVVDNVVRKGDVLNAATDDANVQGMRSVTEFLSRERSVSATAVQTVGSKGHDGFILALVIADPADGLQDT